MTYAALKSLLNDAYADFSSSYIVRKTLGSDELYTNRQILYAKCIFKVLNNQDGDESLDALTTSDIQNCIRLFNKVSNATIPIEYI